MRDVELARIRLCEVLSASGSPRKFKECFMKQNDRGIEYWYMAKPGKCHIVSKDPNVLLIFKEEIGKREFKILDVIL